MILLIYHTNYLKFLIILTLRLKIDIANNTIFIKQILHNWPTHVWK